MDNKFNKLQDIVNKNKQSIRLQEKNNEMIVKTLGVHQVSSESDVDNIDFDGEPMPMLKPSLTKGKSAKIPRKSFILDQEEQTGKLNKRS